MNVSELTKEQINLLIAKSEGLESSHGPSRPHMPMEVRMHDEGAIYWKSGNGYIAKSIYSPCTLWHLGGPIIEKYKIPNEGNLLEAMREVIRRLYGEEVDV